MERRYRVASAQLPQPVNRCASISFGPDSIISGTACPSRQTDLGVSRQVNYTLDQTVPRNRPSWPMMMPNLTAEAENAAPIATLDQACRWAETVPAANTMKGPGRRRTRPGTRQAAVALIARLVAGAAMET